MEHPAEWLALLRIVVGLYFVKSLITKMTVILLGGIVPWPAVSERWLAVMPKIVAKQASDNPLTFYKHFLEGTVIPHSGIFAPLTAFPARLATDFAVSTTVSAALERVAVTPLPLLICPPKWARGWNNAILYLRPA